MKKFMTMLLIVVMVLASAVTAFAAETVDTGKGGDRKITIDNPTKGEDYTVYKLFDATITADGSGINYFYLDASGNRVTKASDLPAALAKYFDVDAAGNITAKSSDVSETMASELAAYAETLAKVAEKTNSNGEALVFDKLQPGYYVVVSSVGTKATIDSAKEADAHIRDKNVKEPSLTKEIDKDDVNIGDTVTYTVTAEGRNYLENLAGGDSQKVVAYRFSDTLPAFISDIKIISVKVTDGATTDVIFPSAANPTVTEKAFGEFEEIKWVDNNGVHKYSNNAVIEIKYTAVVTAQATESNVGVGNVNIITMTPRVIGPDGREVDYQKQWKDDAVTYTYAAALQKVDGTDYDADPQKITLLPGAKFKVKGLTVTGSAGEYTVQSMNDAANADWGTEMEVGADGKLVIHGLKSAQTLRVQETISPDGYNKLTEEFDVTPIVCSKEIVRTETIQYFASVPEAKAPKSEEEWEDYLLETVTSTSTQIEEYNTALEAAAGFKTVKNYKGTEMPATGGIGTTILYTLGGILVVGAGVLLVARRKMDN